MTERLHFHFSLSYVGEGNGNPLQRSCLENPRHGGAWWAAIYGVAQRLKWLGSGSNSSSKYWIEVARSGHVHLISVLREKLSVTSMMLAVGFSQMPCINLRKVPSIPTSLSIFIMKRSWVLPNAFSLSIEVIIGFLFFINMMYYIDWFSYIEIILHTWDKYHLIIVLNPFNIWIWFPSVLVRVYASIIIMNIGL